MEYHKLDTEESTSGCVLWRYRFGGAMTVYYPEEGQGASDQYVSWAVRTGPSVYF